MGWFKRLNNSLIRVNASFSFGTDANGDEIVVGLTTNLIRDSLFTNGSSSNYGIGSIGIVPTGGLKVVDGDGLWQTITVTTVSQSVSPSHSGSPSASGSPSVSPSASGSPSGSASPSA